MVGYVEMAAPEIESMTMAHYEQVLALWKNGGEIILRAADSRSGLERYLNRNVSLSAVATVEAEVVGCLLCGHDSRRGYLQHLMVLPEYRRRGIGTALVRHCLRRLALHGIDKVHADVFAGAAQTQRFWTKLGWIPRTDIIRYSHSQTADPNA
jgi:ribosomal protein S18 acetylase RimI-like enzyme